MNILKSILENDGDMSETDLQLLAKEFPDMTVVIKWAKSERSTHNASDAVKAITDAGEYNGDYPREVFIPCKTMDFLNKVKQALNE